MSGPSERLNYLLDRAGFPAKGQGREDAVVQAFDVALTTASRWISDNTVPRSSAKRLTVARRLGCPEKFWEQGPDTPKNEAAPELIYDSVTAVYLALESLEVGTEALSQDTLTQLYSMVCDNTVTNMGKIDAAFVQELCQLVADLQKARK